jgi:hypothetical protein
MEHKTLTNHEYYNIKKNPKMALHPTIAAYLEQKISDLKSQGYDCRLSIDILGERHGENILYIRPTNEQGIGNEIIFLNTDPDNFASFMDERIADYKKTLNSFLKVKDWVIRAGL